MWPTWIHIGDPHIRPGINRRWSIPILTSSHPILTMFWLNPRATPPIIPRHTKERSSLQHYWSISRRLLIPIVAIIAPLSKVTKSATDLALDSRMKAPTTATHGRTTTTRRARRRSICPLNRSFDKIRRQQNILNRSLLTSFTVEESINYSLKR
ncbi:hypothetical protein V6Z11_A07G207900 [Gossypium hirsutum]